MISSTWFSPTFIVPIAARPFHPSAFCVFSDETVFVVQPQARRGRQDFNALFLVFSVCIGLIRLEMVPRCGALYGVDGTAVPEGITFRPFSTNFHGYTFGGAGGRALQRVVTRLKITGLCLRRQSKFHSLLQFPQ